jgi:hypothetical protein
MFWFSCCFLAVLLYIVKGTNVLAVLSLETNDTCSQAKTASFRTLCQPAWSVCERDEGIDGKPRARGN